MKFTYKLKISTLSLAICLLGVTINNPLYSFEKTHLNTDIKNHFIASAVSGYITDTNGTPIAQANITIEGTSLGTVTNERGYFFIGGLEQGTYTIKVAYVGMETQTKKIIVTTNTEIKVDFTLKQQNEILNEVVVESNQNKFSKKESKTVSHMPISYMQNPQVYSVISKDVMQEQLVTDVQGALVNTPGVSNLVESVGSGGVGLTMYMRGFSTGVNMRNGMATTFVTMTDPVNLERLEVIKGPSATLFGSTLTSYSGLVNRVTKKPYSSFGGEVGYSLGSFGLSRITADINTPLNKDKTVLFRLNAAKHNEKSFQNLGHQNNYAVTPSLTYLVNDRLTLNIEAELFHTNRPSNYIGINKADDGSGVTANSFDELDYNFDFSFGSDQLQSEADVFNVFAQAIYQISDNWTSQTNISTANTDNNANYLFLTYLTDSSIRRMPMNIVSNFNSTQIQQNFNGTMKFGNVENKILVGLDYYYLTTKDRRTRYVYDVISPQDTDADINYQSYLTTLGETDPYARVTREQETYSAYVSDVITIADRLNIMASLRVDHYKNKEADYDQTAFSPKLGITYEVMKDQLTLFGNFMDGFQNVDPSETDGVAVTYDPEHATQIEGGVKADLFNNKLALTASYYDITVRDIVRSVPDPNNIGVFNAVQDGTQNSKGLELEVIANPLTGWNIIAGYGYNESRYTKADIDVEGNKPYSTPYNVANFWTSYNFSKGTLKGFGLGFGGNYVGESYFNDANTFTLPEYTVINSTIFYDQPKYRIGFKLNNITNEEYWAASYWAQPQKTRNFVVNFTYKF
ncbi:TonB-dependent receptor [Neptunitalea lumnitzerae]|uniref:TonB-dependent receptor n=1 Tax=Neptunitalea lumnitzerae TaxID=2965509 RepID=A0ABQ5MFN7_9FLAO|nr:TonB-dependent receptor [Neptunitalea sp. Y10]GLB48218.1 TonB-dependent receptor [Neptunitalea sp. Y10]